ncbi:MAG: DHA2 family efflux MFS transporter permease subunit [bacterium]
MANPPGDKTPTTVEERPEYMEYSSATRWIIMAALIMGTLMQMIDTSIVNVAVPTMMGNLGASLDEITWVTTGYMLANIIMLPLTAWFSSFFGRRKYLAGSMAVFTVASLLCGVSTTLGFLTFARILQGIGGAALISTAQATMMEIFPPEQLGTVQSIYGLGVIVGPALGPTLGGWIVDNMNWHWIFYINIPIGIIATIFTWTFMHDSKYKQKKQGKIDLIGIGLLAVGLGSLQLLLEKGQKNGWFDSEFIIVLAVSAAVALIAFVWWELTIENPVVNLRVLRHRGYTMGVLFGTVFGFGLYGGTFILPVFLQQIQRYTAFQTGLIMLPGVLVTALIMPFTNVIMKKMSPRWLIGLGVSALSISMFMLMLLNADSNPMTLFWPLILRGIAMGIIWVPLTLATLTILKGHEIAEGTSLFNLSRQLGGSMGIAVMTTFLANRIVFHHSVLLEHVSIYQSSIQQRMAMMQAFLMSKGMSASAAYQQALSFMNRTILGQASILGYEDVFLIMGLLFLSTIILLFFFEKSNLRKQRVKVEAEDFE